MTKPMNYQKGEWLSTTKGKLEIINNPMSTCDNTNFLQDDNKIMSKRLEKAKVEIGNNAYKNGSNDYAGRTGYIYYCGTCCRSYRIQFDGIANSEKLNNFIRSKIKINL